MGARKVTPLRHFPCEGIFSKDKVIWAGKIRFARHDNTLSCDVLLQEMNQKGSPGGELKLIARSIL
jgi:hypothetical protein